jgi:hypothetical protein
MSTDICLYLLEKEIPTASDWAFWLQKEFGQELFSDFNLRDFFGFLPCGTSGFEYLAYSITPEEAAEYQINDLNFDFVVTLSAKDEVESKSALCSISILAKITGGMVCDPQTGALYSANEAIILAGAKPK